VFAVFVILFFKDIKPNLAHSRERNSSNKEYCLENKGKDFDCIMGMSVGIDSSYLLYLALKKLGLRPLAFHIDAGWNSQEIVNNIEKMGDQLGLDLFTEVLD